MKTIKFIDENLNNQPGLCPFISPKVNWGRNIESSNVCIYTDRLCYSEIDSKKSNYAWLIEPPIINGENYRDIVNVASKFKKVFSYMKSLETLIPNYIFCPHGGTWLSEEDIKIENKSELISFIFSDKQWNSYHKLRHRIYDMLKTKEIINSDKIDFFGSGCNNKIEKKATGLSKYMFSIVIENSEENDYFTEKIIDCFLTGTIPIYVGNRNIGNYFNEEGIIRFVDPEQLPTILENVSSGLYNSKTEIIKQNFELAKKYIHPEHLITKIIEELEHD